MYLYRHIGVSFRIGRIERQRGAVAVEFALVVPLLVMLLVGTVTTGVSYSHALGVTNAVREGARFGATADAASGTWADDVIARVQATQFDDPTLATTVCVELWEGASTLVDSACTPGGPGVHAADSAHYPIPSTLPAGVCVVRVVAARNFTINAVPLLPSITRKMTRGAVSRFERDSC